MKSVIFSKPQNLVTANLVLLLFLFTQLLSAQTNQLSLADKVRDAIQNEYATDIFVTANNNGRVNLTGSVNTLYDKLRVYQIVSKVDGVNEISDNLGLPDIIIPDDIIKSNILESLAIDSEILEPDKIDVEVDNGIVFLRGQISYKDEKLTAETISAWEKGVKGIENELKVETPVVAKSDKNIESVVNEIIKNRFSLGENTIDATTDNGTVVLTGLAANRWEKYNIRNEIDKIPGVKNVINNLELKTIG